MIGSSLRSRGASRIIPMGLSVRLLAMDGRFLIDVFEEWVRRDVGEVYVQMFDVALANWVGESPGLCIHSETCGLALALEHTGDLYSCDHFVEPRYKLGNIAETRMHELVSSQQQLQFGSTNARRCRTELVATVPISRTQARMRRRRNWFFVPISTLVAAKATGLRPARIPNGSTCTGGPSLRAQRAEPGLDFRQTRLDLRELLLQARRELLLALLEFRRRLLRLSRGRLSLCE